MNEQNHKPTNDEEIEHKYSIWDFYGLFDIHMNQVLTKLKAFLEDVPFLSIEEMSVEAYSCFMRMSALADMFEEYDDFNKYYFLNGRESKDEDYYVQLSQLSRERLNVMSSWNLNNCRFDKKYEVEESSFPRGYKWAKHNEGAECVDGLQKYESLSDFQKIKRNIQCLEAVTSLGVSLEVMNEKGINTSDIANMDLAKQFASFNTLDLPEVRDILSETHVNIVKSFIIYNNLCEHILKHLCECMSKQGWARLDALDDTELFKRFDEMQQIIELTPQYKEYRDNLFIEDLLDEGEPTKDKIKEFKKAFVAKHKSEEIIKAYKLKKNNMPEMLRYLIEKKLDAKQFESLFFYIAILKEVDEYDSKTKEDTEKTLPASTIQSINIILGDVENKIDKNFAPIISK